MTDLSDTVSPASDLFLYVNEKWVERTPIPPDRSTWGSFEILHQDAELAVREILEEARSAGPGTEARKFGDLYASFLDEERANALGAEPIVAPLARVAAIDSREGLIQLVGEWSHVGIGGFFQLYVDNDADEPERYMVYFEQSGLSLPDESYYREDHFASVRDAFVVHAERLFVLAGIDDAPARARRVFDLETQIAKGHWDNVESRDAVKTYNRKPWAEVRALFGAAGSLDLDTWANALEAPDGVFDEVVLRQPSFVDSIAGLLNTADLDAWKDWLALRVVNGYAPYLSQPFVDENFDFYGRTLTGAPELRARWKRAVGFAERAMGEAVGRVYVERHFPPSAKARMDELVANLVEAYRRSITNLEWMSPATRERALDKLAQFTPKIAYPVRWRDYSTLKVDVEDLVANARAGAAFEFRRQLGKIGRPMDRDEWFMTPQTVNAYYNPGLNEIVFPAAILRPPFFDADRDDAANYGAIGAVIGHEIGHGFDDQGSRYDGTGKLQDWWEESDRTAFETRTKALIEQYNALSPVETPGLFVNGALTIGENIGDLGGLGIAWKAYVIAQDGAEPPVIDGLTAAQRFLIGWAYAWRSQIRPAEAERRLAIDPHSPDQFRCNQIVRNLEVFYDAFGVTETDGAFLEPEARVTIW
ncbi:MAG: M13 family metallopeptidase [Acidimicrobiales bacterium]